MDQAHGGSGEGSHAGDDVLPGLRSWPGANARVRRDGRRGDGRLLGRLGDEQLRQIALDRMDGYTTEEIAERLGCARRTVARRLDLIRQTWSEESA